MRAGSERVLKGVRTRGPMTKLLAAVGPAIVAIAGLTAQRGAPIAHAYHPTAQACAAGCEQESPPARFSSQVQLVEVFATVTDAEGKPVIGLRREDFEVYENDELQEVTAFAAGEFPLTVALGVDRSWSMAGDRLRLAKQASRAFLDSLKPGDRSMVIAIGGEADVIAPLTMDRVGQGYAIEALDPWSTTALHDAIIVTLDRLAPEAGRQALIVFSDGIDRYSRATAAQVVERARRSNALIYLIAFGKVRPPLLAELAVITGGRSFLLRDVRELDRTLADVARELRDQYLLGYASSDPIEPDQPEWRAIRVAITKPGFRVRARDGYMSD